MFVFMLLKKVSIKSLLNIKITMLSGCEGSLHINSKERKNNRFKITNFKKKKGKQEHNSNIQCNISWKWK